MDLQVTTPTLTSLKTFDFGKIDEYQIEITSYCNAACPQCPRNLNGSGINPYMPLMHLSRDVIDRRFAEDHCARLRQIFFCGSYGDPIMHPDFLDILQDFRRKNPTLWLYVHTNGGVHEPDYWREIAKIMAGYGQIDFGFDGLEDTLHLYRRNVNYQRAIDNACAFIDAGGRAQWNFIVFRHNEHQVEQARQLAQDMKFFNFLVRRTGRFFDHANEIAMDRWPVLGRNQQIVYWLEQPQNPHWHNDSLKRLPDLKQSYGGNLDDYFRQTPIRCDALLGNKVIISAEGLVLPCNFFTHNLYDARFRDGSLPGANPRHGTGRDNQVRKFLESYGLNNLNINHHDLEEIFQSPMWRDLVESWNNENKLFECAMTCGEKFTKVWDQGGNNR